MRPHSVVALAAVAALLAGGALAQEPVERQPAQTGLETQPPPSSGGRLFYGGYVGAAFGTVQYVELSPLVGVRLSPDFGVGIGLLYRYRNDDRYSNSGSMTDYGGNLFARYHLGSGLFAQAEYDYTNYEVPTTSEQGGTTRDTVSGALAGLGYTSAIGGGAGVYFLVLYDFRYNGSGSNTPYDSPVQYRFGVSVGF